MRRRSVLPLLLVCLLGILVALLLVVESHAPGAKIVSLPTALWYLLTTLTTVGYGDVYPVTNAGRWIGAVFQLMSLGLLGLLIGLLISTLRGRTLSRLKLAFLQKRRWYVFTEKNEASVCLTRAIAQENPAAAILFARTEEDCGVGRSFLQDPASLCRQKKDGDVTLFCLSADEAQNETDARDAAGHASLICCQSSLLPEALPSNEQRFDPTALCARLYWKRHPLTSPQEKILIVGDGAWATALLEQGLLCNVVDPGQQVQYTLAGEFSEFFRIHPQLEQVLEVDSACDGRDKLTVWKDWSQDAQALREMDRIVLIYEHEEETRRQLGLLRRYFPVRGTVYARLSAPVEGAVCFGSPEELYTPALVMHEALNREAKALHAHYQTQNPSAADWNALSDFTRRSNLAAADHLSVKLRILGEEEDTVEARQRAWEKWRKLSPAQRTPLRRIEHARWQRFHLLNGWQYGPVRNRVERTHPSLVPFDDLSPEQQRLDDDSWALLRPTEAASGENGGAV